MECRHGGGPGEFREDAPCEDSRLLAAPEGLDVEAQLRGQGRGDESRESTVSPPRPRVECEKGVVATERVVAQPGERRLDPLRRQRRQVDRLEASLAQDEARLGERDARVVEVERAEDV